MDIVLGVALTSDSVRFVLAGGRNGDGELVGQDSFYVDRRGGVESASVVEHVVNAVLGTYAVVTANGSTIRKIAVTWTDAVAVDAALLVDALDDVGLPGVVPVTGCDAVEGFAALVCVQDRRDGVAVCLVEGRTTPTAFIACAEHADGIRRVRSRVLPAADLHQVALSLRGARAEFDGDDMAVVAAGSSDAVGTLAAQLNSQLETPVVIPRDAGFAFARGAALAACRSSRRLGEAVVSGLEADEADEAAARQAAPLIFVPRVAKLMDIAVDGPRASGGVHRKPESRSVRRLSLVVAGGAAVFISSVSMLVGGQLFGGGRDTAQASPRAGGLELSAASASPVTGPLAPPTPEPPASDPPPAPAPAAVTAAPPVAAPAPPAAPTPVAASPTNPLQVLATLAGPQLAAINQAGQGNLPALNDPALNAAALQVAQAIAGPAIDGAGQPVNIPAVPPVSDQPVTLPPIKDVVDSVRPDRQGEDQHFGDIPKPSTPYYQPPAP